MNGENQGLKHSVSESLLPLYPRPTNPNNGIKEMLINSINLMDNKEILTLKSALGNIHHLASDGELNHENLVQMNQIDDNNEELDDEIEEGESDEEGCVLVFILFRPRK